MSKTHALFLVWGPPSHGPRSRVMARELGIPIEFVFSTQRRGVLVAPWKYLYQAVATAILLLKRRPRVVFVQSPPSFAPGLAAAFAAVTGGSFVIDLHSAAMLAPVWTRPLWLNRFIRSRSALNIVTNEAFRDQIQSEGGRAMIVRDIPTVFDTGPAPGLSEGHHVLVVNKFASDEPVEAVRAAAELCPDVQFHMTGPIEDAPRGFLDGSPPNLRLTGYLPDPDYYALMAASDAVMCLTTRDNTMQRGACEALSMGRPIITSDWPLLRTYFNQGTVHVNAVPESVAEGVREAIASKEALLAGIRSLRRQQQTEWETVSGELLGLLAGAR